jgi:hypothetical protein
VGRISRGIALCFPLTRLAQTAGGNFGWKLFGERTLTLSPEK